MNWTLGVKCPECFNVYLLATKSLKKCLKASPRNIATRGVKNMYTKVKVLSPYPPVIIGRLRRIEEEVVMPRLHMKMIL